MKMGSFIAISALSVLLPVKVIAKGPSSDACNIPADLQREVTRKRPGTRLVSLSDIGDEDRRLFQKDHDDACPGLAKVDFYGDGKPTFALALIKRSESKATTVLVVAHQDEAVWKIMTLDKADGPVPVVWSDKPGEYADVDGEKKIVQPNQLSFFADTLRGLSFMRGKATAWLRFGSPTSCVRNTTYGRASRQCVDRTTRLCAGWADFWIATGLECRTLWFARVRV